MPRYDNVTQLIGRTPVIRVSSQEPKGVELYVKLEASNPGGSVKDRLALGVIEAAEKSGALKPGQTVVEATSGNTGIGLAMVCAQRGYPLVIVMAESFSVERRKLMRHLGAKVVLTPAPQRAVGMMKKTKELADKNGWFWARQFDNEANADMHSRTTAEEILADFPDGLDYWVTGFGTGGTLKGVARVLEERSPKTKIVLAEPENASIYSSDVRQEWPADGVPPVTHPTWNPHPIQGWTPDFVPKLAEDARKYVDEIVQVKGPDAVARSREAARKEGLLVGISAGGTLEAAVQVAKRASAGQRVLCMLPDTGERYLSTPLFEDSPADMTDEERAISLSTPTAQYPAS
jgi:cysteine synthase A